MKSDEKNNEQGTEFPPNGMSKEAWDKLPSNEKAEILISSLRKKRNKIWKLLNPGN